MEPSQLLISSAIFNLVKKRKNGNNAAEKKSSAQIHSHREKLTRAQLHRRASLLQMLQRRADHPCGAAAGVTCRLGLRSGQPQLSMTRTARWLPLARPWVLMVVPRLLRKQALQPALVKKGAKRFTRAQSWRSECDATTTKKNNSMLHFRGNTKDWNKHAEKDSGLALTSAFRSRMVLI